MDRSVMPGLNDGICHKVGHGEMWLAGLLLPGNTTFFFLSPACDIVHLPETCTSRQQDGEERQNERSIVCLSAYLHEMCACVCIRSRWSVYLWARACVHRIRSPWGECPYQARTEDVVHLQWHGLRYQGSACRGDVLFVVLTVLGGLSAFHGAHSVNFAEDHTQDPLISPSTVSL